MPTESDASRRPTIVAERFVCVCMCLYVSRFDIVYLNVCILTAGGVQCSENKSWISTTVPRHINAVIKLSECS